MPDYKNGLGFLLSIDTNDCEIVEVDQAFNEVAVQWFTLDSNFAKNKVVALDPEYGFTIKVDASSAAHQAILAKRYDVDRAVAIILTDPLEGANGSTITFNGELTSIGDPRVIDDVVELDVTIKIADGEPAIVAIP